MGLKGYLAGKAITTIINSLDDNNTISNGINNLVIKTQKKGGLKDKNEHIKILEDKNYLIVKVPSIKIGSLIKGIVQDDFKDIDVDCSYKIYDSNNHIKYKVKSNSSIIDSLEKYNFYNNKNKVVGSINRCLFNCGVPFIEKDVKKCEIKIGNKKFCKIKQSSSFNEKDIDVYEKDIEIKYIKQEKKYIIKYNNVCIANIHELPFSFKDGYEDRYIIEYESKKYEFVALIIFIATCITK